MWQHYGHPSKFGYKDIIPLVEGREVGSRAADGPI